MITETEKALYSINHLTIPTWATHIFKHEDSNIYWFNNKSGIFRCADKPFSETIKAKENHYAFNNCVKIKGK